LDAQKETPFVFNPQPSLGLHSQRQRLPIAKCRLEVLYLLEKHQVAIVVGETGCGKSTQLPQYLLEAGWAAEEGTMVS